MGSLSAWRCLHFPSYADVNGSNLEKSSYYSKEDNAYCYRGKEEPNHDVVIIGWDDDYGAEHFRKSAGRWSLYLPEQLGRILRRGRGIFISPIMTAISGPRARPTQKWRIRTNYDTIYQSDLCGWVGSSRYNRERILAANVFEAQETQQIAAAGFYALGKNTTYQVYMVSNFQDVGSLAGRTPMASGAVENKGYYTIPFDYPVTVEKGSRFAVVIMLETPEALCPWLWSTPPMNGRSMWTSPMGRAISAATVWTGNAWRTRRREISA